MEYVKPVLTVVGAARQLVLGSFPNGTDGAATTAPTKPTPLALGLDD
jgi:hypothetical protein